MYTGKNPSALRSRQKIVSTCLKLMEQSPLEDITIKEIMLESGISRQTFYQIFESKNEILEFVLDGLLADCVKNAAEASGTNLSDTIKLYFTFFNSNKDFIRLLLKNDKYQLLKQSCCNYLLDDQYFLFLQKDYVSKEEKSFAALFLISGMLGMLELWLEKENENSLGPQDLAHLVCRMTNAHSSQG